MESTYADELPCVKWTQHTISSLSCVHLYFYSKTEIQNETATQQTAEQRAHTRTHTRTRLSREMRWKKKKNNMKTNRKWRKNNKISRAKRKQMICIFTLGSHDKIEFATVDIVLRHRAFVIQCENGHILKRFSLNSHHTTEKRKKRNIYIKSSHSIGSRVTESELNPNKTDEIKVRERIASAHVDHRSICQRTFTFLQAIARSRISVSVCVWVEV